MRLLLDEDVPELLTDVLRHLLPEHAVRHVHDMGWTGKKDVQLFRDAVGKFEAILTNNRRQLDVPEEAAQLKKSRMHHICYAQKVDGLRGLALATGAIVAAMPDVMRELSAAGDQRLVTIQSIAGGRYEIVDPRRRPPRYWPR